MSITVNGTTGLNFPDGTSQPTAGFVPFRNKIINGDMRIDQRNNGSAVSINTAGNTYVIDRWRANAVGGGVFSLQRSTLAPPGFSHSILATVTTADSSVASGDFYHFRQSIEGFNFSDLSFGTASAKSVAISFWARSSVVGTYTVLLRNEAGNRGNLSTYTISSANTWEYKTITVAGDTSGSWSVDNTSAAILSFCLGNGSSQTTGSWLSTVSEGASGMTQWISTNGATMYITGVQLEAGESATAFERRTYSTEFSMCRYYFKTVRHDGYRAAIQATNAGAGGTPYFHISTGEIMRATPTITSLGPNLSTAIYGSGTTARSTGYDPVSGGMSVRGYVTGFGSSPGEVMGDVNLQLNAEL